MAASLGEEFARALAAVRDHKQQQAA